MALRHASLLLALAATASWAATPPRSTAPDATAAHTVATVGTHRPSFDLRRFFRRRHVNPLLRYAARGPAKEPVCEQHDLACKAEQKLVRQRLVASCEAGERSVRCLNWWRSFAEQGFRLVGLAGKQFDRDQRAMDSLANALKQVHTANQALRAQNARLAATADDAQRQTDAMREEEIREVDRAYDTAERAVDAAQAIAQDSASDADMAAMMSIMNSSAAPVTAPGAPALAPYVHCTSRRVGMGSYAHVETDCN